MYSQNTLSQQSKGLFRSCWILFLQNVVILVAPNPVCKDIVVFFAPNLNFSIQSYIQTYGNTHVYITGIVFNLHAKLQKCVYHNSPNMSKDFSICISGALTLSFLSSSGKTFAEPLIHKNQHGCSAACRMVDQLFTIAREENFGGSCVFWICRSLVTMSFTYPKLLLY